MIEHRNNLQSTSNELKDPFSYNILTVNVQVQDKVTLWMRSLSQCYILPLACTTKSLTLSDYPIHNFVMSTSVIHESLMYTKSTLLLTFSSHLCCSVTSQLLNCVLGLDNLSCKPSIIMLKYAHYHANLIPWTLSWFKTYRRYFFGWFSFNSGSILTISLWMMARST